MSLIAAEFERSGIPTVAIQLVKSLATTLRPPRALCVPFRFGYPLGNPGDREQQKRVLKSALLLLETADAAPPLLIDYAAESDEFQDN